MGKTNPAGVGHLGFAFLQAIVVSDDGGGKSGRDEAGEYEKSRGDLNHCGISQEMIEKRDDC